MNIRTTVLLAAAAWAAWTGPCAANDAKQLAAKVCANCHGAQGVSPTPAYPSLAAQQAAYLEVQLRGFRDRTRGDPSAVAMMWGMSSQLTDDLIKDLARYYAALPPPAGSGAAKALLERGARVYAEGLAERGIPACMSCHGAKAEGNEAVPRLAGQHAAYVVKQLAYFKSQQRGNAVMHTVAGDLSLEEMEAIAAYVASR
jgi:cytochrome c553